MNKLRRAADIGVMLARHAPDLRSRLTLLACYAKTLTDIASKEEVALRLRVGTGLFPFRMRKSDVFTLDEVLLEGQYRLASTLGERPVILDAGANIGVAALWFLGHHPEATLHCFEPDPANFRLLRENLGGMSRVALEQSALGARSGPMTLHLAEHGAMHSLVGDGSPAGTIEVVCVRLSDYVRQRDITRIDLLKIDVEGSELDVLRGAGEVLERVGVIVGEVHEALVDADAVDALLRARGFRTIEKRQLSSGRKDRTLIFEAAR